MSLLQDLLVEIGRVQKSSIDTNKIAELQAMTKPTGWPVGRPSIDSEALAGEQICDLLVAGELLRVKICERPWTCRIGSRSFAGWIETLILQQ